MYIKTEQALFERHGKITKRIEILVKQSSPEDLIRNQSKISKLLAYQYRNFDIQNIAVHENWYDLVYNIYQKIQDGIKRKSITSFSINQYRYLFQRVLRSKYQPQTIMEYPLIRKLKQWKNKTTQFDKFLEKITIGQKKLHSYDCINCSECFYQQLTIQVSNQQKIFALENFKTKMLKIHDDQVKLQEVKLAKYMTKLLNSQYGALLIGATKNRFDQVIVKGISLFPEQMLQIKLSIMNVRKKYIFPPPNDDQTFQISFVPVCCDQLFSGNIEKKIQSYISFKEQKYVIRIFFHSKQAKKSYFFIEEKQKNMYNYKLVANPPNDQFEGEKIYENIHKIYSKKDTVRRQLSHHLIKCKSIDNNDVDGVIGQTIQANEKVYVDPDKYGIKPYKLYLYHSILIVDKKGNNHFNKFKEMIGTSDMDIILTPIYEKFHKKNHRTVYYMTHRRKYEDIKKIVEGLDATRKNLVLMKIKEQLSLLRQDLFNDAYEQLADKFEAYYLTKLQIRYIAIPKYGKLQYEFIFKFENESQAIFAFTLLEMGDIRANFVNAGKLDGSRPYEEYLAMVEQQNELQSNFQNYGELGQTNKTEKPQKQVQASNQQQKTNSFNQQSQFDQYGQYNQSLQQYYGQNNGQSYAQPNYIPPNYGQFQQNPYYQNQLFQHSQNWSNQQQMNAFYGNPQQNYQSFFQNPNPTHQMHHSQYSLQQISSQNNQNQSKSQSSVHK